MVKDVKYIIKRIIIGTGIAIALMLLKGNLLIGVSAKEMSSNSYQGLSVAINGTDNNYFWDLTDGSWENWGSGTLIGSGAIIKTNGTSTSGFATVRSVLAYSGNQTFHCKIGSTSNNNSTYFNQSFTFECPMVMGQYGLQQLAFVFAQPNNVVDFTMKLQVNGTMTFIKDDPADSSSTAINNQITNDNTNTTNIINNQNDNTQDIIDNQNDNTEAQIESQKVCNNITIDKNSIVTDGYLREDGSISDNPFSQQTYGITDYISFDNYIEVLLSGQNNVYTCFYNSSKTLISCVNTMNNSSISVPIGSKFIRVSINKSDNRPQFLIRSCKNGNQAIADGQQDINNTLNDTSGVSDNDIEELFGDFEDSDSPISDLLTMPITLAQAYLNGFGGTCSAINLGSLYGTNLIIPCIDLQDKLGSTLWSLIDVLFSLFMLYNIGMLIVKVFDGITSLNDQFDEAMGRGVN